MVEEKILKWILNQSSSYKTTKPDNKGIETFHRSFLDQDLAGLQTAHSKSKWSSLEVALLEEEKGNIFSPR